MGVLVLLYMHYMLYCYVPQTLLCNYNIISNLKRFRSQAFVSIRAHMININSKENIFIIKISFIKLNLRMHN